MFSSLIHRLYDAPCACCSFMPEGLKSWGKKTDDSPIFPRTQKLFNVESKTYIGSKTLCEWSKTIFLWTWIVLSLQLRGCAHHSCWQCGTWVPCTTEVVISPCPSYHNHSRMFLYWSTRVFLKHVCVSVHTKTPLSVNFDTTGLSLTLTFSDDVINDEEEMAFSSIIRDW